MRSGDGVSLYQLDGDVKGLEGPIQYVGPVAARLALDADAKKAKTGQLSEPMAGKAVELRAASKITLQDAKLDDITLTVTENDKPQSFTGSAFVSWGEIPRLDLTVESSWFDIDQMLRADARNVRPVPSAAIAALPRIFEGWSFTPRRGQIKAKIKQASLGGDVIEGLNFTASHDAGGWQIETLVARLPGDTNIDVKGTLPAGDQLGFDGDFTLDGKNLSRLLRWAAPSLGVVDAGNAQSFSLASGMTLTPTRLAFRDCQGRAGRFAPSPSTWRMITGRIRSCCWHFRATIWICAACSPATPAQARNPCPRRPRPSIPRPPTGARKPSRRARPISPMCCRRCSRPSSPMSAC